jgi:trigger factor
VAFNLKDDPRMQQRLQGAVGLLSQKDIDAPPAELPPLADIAVEVKAPAPPTDLEILQRYRDRLRAISKVTPLAPGDPIAIGDEVCVSTVAHVNGALVATSVRAEHWLTLAPDPSLLGFAEQIAGLAVGTSAVVPVVLADGRAAAVAVRIHEAQRVEMPHPEAEATVALLGLAPTLEATLQKLGEELVQESIASSPLLAMREGMKKLAELAVIDVPPVAVDAEIQRAWRVAEGDACMALGLTVEEQQESLKLWLADAGIRDEALLRLKTWAALKAVAARDQLTLSEQGWARFFAAYAPPLGQSPEFLRAEVDKDPKAKAELQELAFRMQVVDYVLSQIHIAFI